VISEIRGPLIFCCRPQRALGRDSAPYDVHRRDRERSDRFGSTVAGVGPTLLTSVPGSGLNESLLLLFDRAKRDAKSRSAEHIRTVTCALAVAIRRFAEDAGKVNMAPANHPHVVKVRSNWVGPAGTFFLPA